ncbi:hypothetical protein EsH8_V_000116 [Colletotrichum jinshuiense]
MLLAILFLLFVCETLVSAESFTLAAYAPNRPEVHGKPINAYNQRFYIGLDTPSSFCPSSPHIACPEGDTTTVDEEFTQLRVAVPGGQAVYIDSDGVISYTAAHSARIPPHSTTNGFYRHVVAPQCSLEEEIHLIRYAMPGPGPNFTESNIYACPHSMVPSRWLLETVWRPREEDEWAGPCFSLEGLQLQRSEIEVGAWQY